ncbi:MAG: fused MFS/spermidine synthase [Candidatus Eisenbacteria bacterium]|nr:fused MFS/spermidine synthase [Candidatus Eisenbacteria bacterium]
MTSSRSKAATIRRAAHSESGTGGLSGTDLAVLGLFFLSGASALVYQVVWSRLFTFVFGGTASAIATVLSAYMAGLAIGSYLFGRRIDRGGHPLVIYAILEAGIAGWAIVLPFILTLLDGLYGGLYRSLNPGPMGLSLIRFALSFLVLLVPTILMGGTLPVLSRLLVDNRSAVGLKAGLLYAINTIGAVAGTASAGFFLIPAFGMRSATWIAVAFNILVTLLAVLLVRRIAVPNPGAIKDGPPTLIDTASPPPADVRAGAGGVRRAALVVYALSGFAALTYEVAWTKVLSGALGTTTYAFTAMLTTFLAGLSLGAMIAARWLNRFEPARMMALMQLGIAVLALMALPLFGNLPILFIQAFKTWGPSWPAQVFSRFVLCTITMLPPTILMGAAFPLVARLYTQGTVGLGRKVGEMYAANTVGAILGSFVAGFIFIPAIGRQSTILVAVGVNLLSALILYTVLARAGWMNRRAWIPAGVLAAAALSLLPITARRWDPYLMASGAYVYAESYAKDKDMTASIHEQRLLLFKEESEAILSVWRSQHVLSLRTNGKVEASSSGDMLTQKMISHLPILYHRAPSDVLMIGLASGISLGSVIVHPEVSKADCVEMLAGMREVSDYFRKWNHDALRDPRTKLLINDGRNYLQLTDRMYDVIISQPSNPWIVGIGSLFTREFFQLGARRLNPDGIFCQWVQTYQMSRADFGSILKTYHEVFPHVAIWMGVPGDVILVGGRQPLGLDWNRLHDRLAVPSVAEDLDVVGVTDPESFLTAYLGGEAMLTSLTREAGPIITDDNLLLEFSMPQNLYDPHVLMMDQAVLIPLRGRLTSTLTNGPADSLEQLSARLFEGRRLTLAGVMQWQAGRNAETVATLEQALRLVPGDPLAIHYLSQTRNSIGLTLLEGGQTTQALGEFRRAAAVGSPSERALALNNIGLQYFSDDQPDSARDYWQRAVDIEPDSPIIHYNLALVEEKLGRPLNAAGHYRTVIELEPENAGALNNLAWILSQDVATAAEAVGFARRAVAVEPVDPYRDTLGWSLFQSGDMVLAEKIFRDIMLRAPDNLEARFHLARLLIQKGQGPLARPLLDEVARRAKGQPLGEQAAAELKALR